MDTSREAWERIVNGFTFHMRGDEEIVVQSEPKDPELDKAVRDARAATSGMLLSPDDRVYASLLQIAEGMLEYDEPGEDALQEIIEGIVSPYDFEALKWFKEAPGAVEACDEVLASYPARSIVSVISWGWVLWLEWVAAPLVNLAEKWAEEASE